MGFVVRHGGEAIPLMGQAAYAYGAYKARDKRAARALQARMQDKSLQAREDSQIMAIQAQQDRDVEMATRRTRDLEQQARIGRESAEQQYGLREDFAEKKFDMERDRMEFGLEQKKDIYDFEYSERDKRRVAEFDAQHQQISDLERNGTLSPQEANEFHQQIDLARAGVEKSKRKQWPEGKDVGQSWELGEVGSGMWVGRKSDGTVAKLFDGRADEGDEKKEQAKRVSDSRKSLEKIQAEKRKYIAGLEKEMTKGGVDMEPSPRYTPSEVKRRAAAIFNDRIFEAQMNLVDARLGTEGGPPGAGIRETEAPGAWLGMTGEQPPAEEIAPGATFGGGAFGGGASGAGGASGGVAGGGGVGQFASAEAEFGGPGGQAVPIAQVPTMLQKYEALAQQGKLTAKQRELYERLKALAQTRGLGAR